MAARIRPRCIFSAVINVRLLSGLLFSAVASMTVQRVVHTISSANRTTITANSLHDLRAHGVGLRDAVGDEQQQGQQHEVGDDRGARRRR